MKLLRYITLSLLALFVSFGAYAQIGAAMRIAPEFTLIGDIKGAGDVKVTLEKLGTPGIYAETTAKNGKFEMPKCKSTMPHPFKLTVGSKSMFIALNNGKITVVGDINDLQNAKVEGASSHAEYMNLLSMLANCKTEMDREVAMENFMSKNSHSWISIYCLHVLYEKYPESTQKIRQLLSYVVHYKGSSHYDDIDKAITKIEASEE